MRFHVTPPERISDEMLEQVYLAGFDQNPWPVQASRCEATGEGHGELILHRSVSDSADLFVPWPVKGHGTVTICTGSLMEREKPYYLPHELVRGKISQLRNQINQWQSQGLAVPREIFQGHWAAVDAFRESMQHPRDSLEASAAAEWSLSIAMDTIVRLAECYTDQALNLRTRASGAAKLMFGAELGGAVLDNVTATAFATTFNAARVPLPWGEIESSEAERHWDLADRQIAWCKANGLTVCAGPLLQFDSHGLPDWLYLFEDDFESLMEAITQFTEAAVTRYRDKVDVWLCAARANTADVLALDEEQIVRIVAEMLRRTRGLAPQTPLLVSFDQPWMEYAAHSPFLRNPRSQQQPSRRPLDITPLHFADLLVRAELGLSGFMLEINMGYHPAGTLPRDVCDVSRMLDMWACLDRPLYISSCVSSSSSPDPLARRPSTSLCGGGPSQSQAAWIARYMPMMMSKPYVKGIFWNQLADSRPHDFPHGGLFDRQGRPKPSLAALAAVRPAKRP